MKLFTTTMALATLGPDFRTRTTIETTGILDRAGLLRGDLVLVGRGDANLSNRVFPFARQGERSGPTDKALAELADQVVAHGVKQIRGDIVADDSYFALARFPSGLDGGRYGVELRRGGFGDCGERQCAEPAGASGRGRGMPARVAWDPWPGPYSVRNEARTVAAGTADATLSLSRDPESKVFHPGRHGGGGCTGAVAFAGRAGTGGTGCGAAEEVARSARRAHHRQEPRPPRRRPWSVEARASEGKILAERFSPTLIEDMRLTNKLSQNLHAELMLRVAAKEGAGAETLDDALKFAAQFRESIGIAPGDVTQSDGSGLSRNGLVTPQSVVQRAVVRGQAAVGPKRLPRRCRWPARTARSKIA